MILISDQALQNIAIMIWYLKGNHSQWIFNWVRKKSGNFEAGSLYEPCCCRFLLTSLTYKIVSKYSGRVLITQLMPIIHHGSNLSSTFNFIDHSRYVPGINGAIALVGRGLHFTAGAKAPWWQWHGWPSTQPSRPAHNRALRSTQPGKLKTKWRYVNASIRHQN